MSMGSLRFSQYGPANPSWQTGHPFLHVVTARHFSGQKLLHWSVPFDVGIQAEIDECIDVKHALINIFNTIKSLLSYKTNSNIPSDISNTKFSYCKLKDINLYDIFNHSTTCLLSKAGLLHLAITTSQKV